MKPQPKINTLMKSIILSTLLIISFFFVDAQCEDAYYPLEEGTTWTITNYNKKGKPQGKTVNAIISSTETSEGYEVLVTSQLIDDKDEQLTDGEYTVICEGGVLKIDLENFIPTSIMEQYEGMEVTFESDNLQFPNDLASGQQLPEATGKMTVQMSEGPMAMTTEMDFLYKDRTVEGEEQITTPAGTFDTKKISQTIVTKISMMGMDKTVEYKSVTWMTPQYGMIRSESFNKKGKLSGYSLLTYFEK